jgi:hypothetical protein
MKTDTFKNIFLEAWDEHIEPLFADGTLVWKSNKTLDDYLMKVANGSLSDDEILKLIEEGKI